MKLTTEWTGLFLYKYSILPPLLGFALGTILNEYVSEVWFLILAMGVIFGTLAIFFVNLRFLLLIPIGLLFASNPLLNQDAEIMNFIDTKVDIEGTLYKSPEQREYGSRIFLDTETVIREERREPANGRILITTGEFIEGLSYGDRVRVLNIELRGLRNFLNPGGFDFKNYYERQGIRASGFVEGEEYIISFGRDSSSNPVLHYIDKIRIRFASYVNNNFLFPESALLNAITVGYKGGIPQELRTEFSRAGVAHILAISGLHVGAVAVFFYFLLKFALSRSEYLLLGFQMPRVAAGLAIIPVFLYTALAGFSTSAVRAFIMISLYLISIVIGRDENKINTLGAAALIILIWHPWALFELSFRLSFSAVLGILLVHKFYPFKFATSRDKFYSLIKSTVAAGFVTLPLVVNSFGILPLVSIPANVILIPFVEFLIIPLGLISLFAFLISPYLAEPIISFNLILIDVVVFGIEKLTDIPYSYFTMPRLSPISWTLFIATGVALLLTGTLRKLKYVLPVLVVGFVVSSFISVSDKSPPGKVQVNILDAGPNRSAVFITLPEGKNMLIDGGYKRFGRSGYTERAVIAKYLLWRGVRNIDYLILTSTDKDHLRGVKYLLENFSVKNFWTNGDKLEGGVWEIIYERGIQWYNLLGYNLLGHDLLERPELPATAEYKLEIIKPGSDFKIKDTSLPYPIALKLTGPGLSLLTGEGLHLENVQISLLKLFGDELKSMVLYMPLIKTNDSLELFINTVSPEVFVTNVIDDLDLPAIDIPPSVFQTSVDGTVTIEGENNDLVIKNYTGD
jgi:DNA internalization-related competence protein ComEC/Rec2